MKPPLASPAPGARRSAARQLLALKEAGHEQVGVGLRRLDLADLDVHGYVKAASCGERASLRVDGVHGSINFRIIQSLQTGVPGDASSSAALLGLTCPARFEQELCGWVHSAWVSDAVQGAVELAVATDAGAAGCGCRRGGNGGDAGQRASLASEEKRSTGGLGEELCAVSVPQREGRAAGAPGRAPARRSRARAQRRAWCDRGSRAQLAGDPHPSACSARESLRATGRARRCGPGSRRQLEIGREMVQVPTQALLVLSEL